MLLAMGFVGPERGGVIAELGLRVTDRGNVWRDERWMTSEDGIFAAGDMQRGQSLIVWAIADGRNAAARGGCLPDGRIEPLGGADRVIPAARS